METSVHINKRNKEYHVNVGKLMLYVKEYA